MRRWEKFHQLCEPVVSKSLNHSQFFLTADQIHRHQMSCGGRVTLVNAPSARLDGANARNYSHCCHVVLGFMQVRVSRRFESDCSQ
jgi:hypothetical protein